MFTSCFEVSIGTQCWTDVLHSLRFTQTFRETGTHSSTFWQLCCQSHHFCPPANPQHGNRGFNPFPQVETTSSLIYLFSCSSLSDGQAAWAAVESSRMGQRWVSGIIHLWNTALPLKESWRKEGQHVGSVPPQHQPKLALLYSLSYLGKHIAGLSPQNWLCGMNAGREEKQEECLNGVWVWMPCLFHSICLKLLSPPSFFYSLRCLYLRVFCCTSNIPMR